MPGPLAGIKVVEIGVWVAGPAAAGLLADWGADVVKIEPPEGDPARVFKKMLGAEMPTNAVFELDNRSKSSVAIDLTKPEGVALAKELIAEADVFVTNLRTGALARLGLDYETLAPEFPELIYAHITGYGREGDEADRPGFDIAAFWAYSGMAHLLTPAESDPPFQRGGMGDHATGLAAAGAISTALFARERHGGGQLVSTSLLRMGAYQIGFDMNIALMWGMTLDTGKRETMRNPTANNYLCADGKRIWIVGIDMERHWAPLTRAVGRPEWASDERWDSVRGRAVNNVELIENLDAIFITKTRDEWAEVFASEPELFWAPVNTPEDLIADPQFAAAGGLVEVPDGAATSTMVASPVDFSGTPWAPRDSAPDVGENNREVLEALGKSAEQIDGYIASGVIVESSES